MPALQALRVVPRMPPFGAMCGRNTHKLNWAEIVALYRLTLPEKFVGPSYNVAPMRVMPIVGPAGNGRELIMAAWGLVPYCLKPQTARQASIFHDQC
jgi:putative SOS response-associated peptidase YedK